MVHVPQTVDVESFVEACRSVVGEVDLVRRQRLPPTADSESDRPQSTAHLTDRQRDVLRVAYRNGFFEWPRERTGEEIADLLEVSAPTFHRHVRIGTERLLTSLFE